jgi:hypothetical protein
VKKQRKKLSMKFVCCILSDSEPAPTLKFEVIQLFLLFEIARIANTVMGFIENFTYMRHGIKIQNINKIFK